MRERHFKAIRQATERLNRYCFRLTYPGRGRPIPSILINALPKSGSTYIIRSLRRALLLGPCDLGANGVSAIALNLDAMEEFAKGDRVSHQHLPAEPHIVAGLELMAPKMVLNLRDPRAALVSWTHFVNEFNSDHSFLMALQSVEQAITPDYFKLPFPEQLSWQVDHYLPKVIAWISDWLAVVDNPQSGLDILVTEYADLARDAAAFLKRILDFYQIDIEPQWLTIREPKPGSWKFRVGTGKDWREDYTPDTMVRATEQMPVSWADRFGWR